MKRIIGCLIAVCVSAQAERWMPAIFNNGMVLQSGSAGMFLMLGALAVIITMTFPPLLKGIGLGGAYGLYTLCALLSFFFVRRWVKETRGKTLEEM